MAKTVEEGFRSFHDDRLTQNTTETDAAKSHRATLEASLKANFAITRFFRTGSVGNGTGVRHHSDIDYFASIPAGHQRANSDTMLRVMRDVLNDRFSRTDVVVRTPAVLVPFGRDGSESTEIIPAKYIEKDKAGNLVYGIANGSGTWMRSSPDAHNGYVASIDKRLGGKVKPFVRFLKAWKYYQNVPILSFYLELRVAKYASGEGAIVYSIDLRNILKELWDNQLAAMQDPMGVSGYIYPCATDAKKQEALSKLNTALGRAQKARDAEMAKKDSDAFYWWDLLFADKFPAY